MVVVVLDEEDAREGAGAAVGFLMGADAAAAAGVESESESDGSEDAVSWGKGEESDGKRVERRGERTVGFDLADVLRFCTYQKRQVSPFQPFPSGRTKTSKRMNNEPM